MGSEKGNMVDDPENENQPQAEDTVDEILRRVDALPVIDNRSPDEIVGYDANGLPASDTARTESVSPTQEQAGNEFDFEAYRQEILSDPKAKHIIETFLKYRHRERES